MEKKVEVPIYIDRPTIEHIHHPPPPKEIITQTPIVDQVVKTTVYQKEDTGHILSLENELACLKQVIDNLTHDKRSLINDNQGLHS